MTPKAATIPIVRCSYLESFMSAQPPSDPNRSSVPGYIVVLAAFSVVLLLFSLAVGLIAFGVVDLPWDDEVPVPTVGVPGQMLQASGFGVLASRDVDGKKEIDVTVAVTNTGTERLTNSMMLVQCLDGGNASNSQLIVGIDPGQTLKYRLTLYGTGDPACTSPQIDFDTP